MLVDVGIVLEKVLLLDHNDADNQRRCISSRNMEALYKHPKNSVNSVSWLSPPLGPANEVLLRIIVTLDSQIIRIGPLTTLRLD